MTNKRKSSGGENKEEDFTALISNKHPCIIHPNHHQDVNVDSNPTVNYFDFSFSTVAAHPATPPPAENFIIPIPILARNPNSVIHRGPSGSTRAPRARKNPNNPNPTQGRASRARTKSQTIPVPFPWATDRRARVHSMDHLRASGIEKIKGNVQCKKCEKSFMIEYDFREKFNEIATYIVNNKSIMHQRAPPAWMNPNLPTCNFCGHENSCKPLIGEKKRAINWLFLLLGQLLGCCTLEQLKYFCKHTKNHRTGAKDRVLYQSYLELCQQLDPT